MASSTDPEQTTHMDSLIWVYTVCSGFTLFGHCYSKYRISLVIRWIFILPKQSQRSRSVLKDGSRSLGLFGKGKIGIIAKFHRTDLII